MACTSQNTWLQLITAHPSNANFKALVQWMEHISAKIVFVYQLAKAEFRGIDRRIVYKPYYAHIYADLPLSAIDTDRVTASQVSRFRRLVVRTPRKRHLVYLPRVQSLSS